MVAQANKRSREVKQLKRQLRKAEKRTRGSGGLSAKYFVRVIAVIVIVVTITLIADYMQYTLGAEVQEIDEPSIKITKKSSFLADRNIGNVNMDNINGVMYGDLDFGNIDIDKALVPSDDAYRLNMEILEIAIRATNIDAYKEAYPAASDNILHSTFYEMFDPLMVMAKSRTEWGGQASPEYAITPFVPGSVLKSIGVSPADTIASEVSGAKYPAMKSRDSSTNYKGPLQIHSSYLPNHTLTIPSNLKNPVDQYTIEDSLVYVGLKFAATMKNVHKDFKYYTIQSPYELVALLGLSHNTGGSIYTQSNEWTNGHRDGYPWLNTGTLRQYLSDVCRQSNLAIILDKAEKDFLAIKEDPAGSNFNFKRLDMNVAVDMIEQMDLDISDYLWPDAVEIYYKRRSPLGRVNSPREKPAYAVQAIYEYHMLRLFYSSGGGA